MHMMQPSFSGVNGMTYANAPTCDDVMVPRWYGYVMSRLDTWTGPWTCSLPNHLQDAEEGPPKLQ